MNSHTRAFLGVAVLFAALCLPLILTQGGGYSYDEANYHIPAILQIRSHWPRLDIERDSLSATPPGYHYFLATLSLVIGQGRLNLRLVNWGVSLALLGVLWWRFDARRRNLALMGILPLLASNFFVKSASWVVTDNAALLGTAVVLLGALADTQGPPTWAQGVVAAATTFVRQTCVWLAAPIAFRALRLRGWSRLQVLASLMPILVLGFLYSRWEGMVPRVWRTAAVQGGGTANGLAAIAYILTVFFLLGAAYFCVVSAKGDWRLDLCGKWAAIGSVLGILAAVGGPNDFDRSAGRWGGYLWALIAAIPAAFHRSVFLMVMAPLGGALLGAMCASLSRRAGRARAAIWAGSYGAWAATYLPNRQVFQRYYEPATLIFLILWLALSTDGLPAVRIRRMWPLAGVSLVQLAITFLFAYGRTFSPGH